MTNTIDIEEERKAFEKEANAARFFPAELDFSMTKSPSGRDEYVNTHLQSKWEGWFLARRYSVGAEPVAYEHGIADLILALDIWKAAKAGEESTLALDRLQSLINRLAAPPSADAKDAIETLRSIAKIDTRKITVESCKRIAQDAIHRFDAAIEKERNK